MAKELIKTGISDKILLIRGVSVMLDSDLAALYGVETKILNKAVKRNIERFPYEFMFQLTKEEWESLTFQNGISSSKSVQGLRFQSGTSNKGGRRYMPYAFTEQGVAMLSSVLKSKRAVAINIEIMKTFVAIRRYALKAQADERVASRLGVLEKALLSTDKRVDEIIKVLNTMLQLEDKEVKKIGFKKD